MITFCKYDPTQASIWNKFNRDSKNGLFLFDRNYMDYHSDRFKDNSLMFYENNKVIALLPCNIKDSILYSHQGLTFGGFITNDSMKQVKMLECFETLKEYMYKNNINELIYKATPYIYHKKPAQEDIYALFVNNAENYRVDCSSTINLGDIYRISKGRKAQISRAKREKIEIFEITHIDDFTKLLNKVLNKRHNVCATHSVNELKLLQSRFPNEIKIFGAFKNDEMVAATLLFIYENIIHTQYLASNDLGRKLGALDLLIHTLIEKYKNNKKYFDFGISNEDNGRYLNEGLISQKEGFGARTIIHNFYKLSIE